MKTYWTTFYSYKGGVGRSLALANVAALFAKRGHTVVLIDFDLEAPGLDAFSEFEGAREKSGVVEYVAEFQKKQAAPDISAFVHPIKLPPHIRGRLWAMPAGRKDKAYNHLLARTKWAELFETGLGLPFIENWKLSIEDEFRPDYVLIDSRTGLTEIGGVCTTVFPDLVVMLFGLNSQNIEGTAAVARHIREANLEKQPQLHFVATPLPNFPPDKSSPLQRRIEEAEKVLGVGIASNSIAYWPLASLSEKLFVLDDTFGDSTLVRDHKSLVEKICDHNRYGIDFLTKQSEKAIKSDDTQMGAKLSEVLLREFPSRPEAVFVRSSLARIDGRSEDAIALAMEAVRLDRSYKPAYDFLLASFQRLKLFNEMEALCESILDAGDRVSKAERKSVLDTLAHLRMSIGKYAEAHRIYHSINTDYGSNGANEHNLIFELPPRFNAAESARRAGRIVDKEKWREIVRMFEKCSIIKEIPTMDANCNQAVHIAYALIGDISAAKECLKRALRVAATFNEFEQVFSVHNYQQVDREKFEAIVKEMLLALEQGKLWDGTCLATS